MYRGVLEFRRLLFRLRPNWGRKSNLLEIKYCSRLYLYLLSHFDNLDNTTWAENNRFKAVQKKVGRTIQRLENWEQRGPSLPLGVHGEKTWFHLLLLQSISHLTQLYLAHYTLSLLPSHLSVPRLLLAIQKLWVELLGNPKRYISPI